MMDFLAGNSRSGGAPIAIPDAIPERQVHERVGPVLAGPHVQFPGRYLCAAARC